MADIKGTTKSKYSNLGKMKYKTALDLSFLKYKQTELTYQNQKLKSQNKQIQQELENTGLRGA